MHGRAQDDLAVYDLPYGLDGDRWDPRLNALDGASYWASHPNVEGWPTDGKAHPERTTVTGFSAASLALVIARTDEC